MSDEPLRDSVIKNINLIALNLGDQGREKIADHVRRFWSPSLRATLVTLTQEDNEVLTPLAKEAAKIL